MSKEEKKKDVSLNPERSYHEKGRSFKQKLLYARIEINNPTRGGTDNFKKRKYVTLQDLYDAVLPHLLFERLLLVNTKVHNENGYFLKTEIIDVDSDESITTYAMLNPNLKIQEHGAELTYHSRYNLGCLLSIRTDYDDDADSIKNKENKKAQNYITGEQMHGLTHVLSSLTVEQYNELLRILSIKDFSKVPKDKYEKTVQFIRNYINKHTEGETKGEIK